MPNEDRIHEAVRIVSASPDGDYFVTGAWERTVTVWSVQDRRAVSNFETVLEPGGERLAIIGGEVPRVYAAAWERHGVVCYDALTGEQVWQRQDLKRPQGLVPISSSRLAVLREGPAEIVDATTGVSHRRLRGVTSVFPSVDRTQVLTFERGTKRVALRDAHTFKPAWTRLIESFGVLDAVVTKHHVIFSTASQTVHACSRTTGELIWEHLSEGWNVTHIGFQASGEAILVSNQLSGDRHGANKSRFLVVDAATGSVKRETLSVQIHDAAFLSSGEGVVIACSPSDGVIESDVRSFDGVERQWHVHSGTHPTNRAEALEKLQALSSQPPR